MNCTKIALFSPGRTGSQFVCGLIKEHFNLEVLEWFSSAFIREKPGTSDKEFLNYVLQCLISKDKPFGIKVTPAAFDDRWKSERELTEAILKATGNAHQILLYRHDFWGACISDWMAHRTGVWHSNAKPNPRLDVPFKSVVDHVRRSEIGIFAAYAEHSKDRCHIISYESLLNSPLAFSHDILRFMSPSNTAFSSINLVNSTKKITAPDSPRYLELLDQLPTGDIDYFYDQKQGRDRFICSMLKTLT